MFSIPTEFSQFDTDGSDSCQLFFRLNVSQTTPWEVKNARFLNSTSTITFYEPTVANLSLITVKPPRFWNGLLVATFVAECKELTIDQSIGCEKRIEHNVVPVADPAVVNTPKIGSATAGSTITIAYSIQPLDSSESVAAEIMNPSPFITIATRRVCNFKTLLYLNSTHERSSQSISIVFLSQSCCVANNVYCSPRDNHSLRISISFSLFEHGCKLHGTKVGITLLHYSKESFCGSLVNLVPVR